MRLVIPSDIATELREALTRGGRREIGGVLMGEHIDVNTFRVTKITVQLTGGTFASFVRLVSGILGPLRAFFQATNQEYEKFNYVGEWHSHHSFALEPSDKDRATMEDLLADPQLGARFAALLLVKLDRADALVCAVRFYRPHAAPAVGAVELVTRRV